MAYSFEELGMGMARSLEERMERLRGRHTRGADGPVYFLLHKEDLAYLLDRHAEDMERGKKMYWCHTFHGIQMIESPLASKGIPLAVVSYA
jgi:hypothetical protein